MTTTSSKTTTVNATPKATPLFGGALSIVLPGDTDNTYLDVSTFRQVPDNQEVFVDGSRTDDSVIVELLECADEEQQTPAGYEACASACDLFGR